MPLTGMDIGQIRSLAGQMVRAVTDLRGLIRDLTAELESAPWRGPDRDRFIDEWRSHHVVRLSRVADGLQDASGSCREYARRQEDASR
jgi:hypothetical protein